MKIVIIVLFIILMHFIIGFLCSIYFISHPNCFVWEEPNGERDLPELYVAILLGNLWPIAIIYFIILKSGRLYAASVRYFANRIINKKGDYK